MLDTANAEILVDGESTGGIDAHGFWFASGGEEPWVLTRETNDGIVLDPATDEVIDEIVAPGPAQSENNDERDTPDITWATPESECMVVTLRGSKLVAGAPNGATGVNPGFAVLDTESRGSRDGRRPGP